MRVAAFDSKPFNRSRAAKGQGAVAAKEYTGHSTQLGTGVVISDADAFADKFVTEFAKLKGEFGIDTSLPFMSTNGLLKHGRRKAIAFADKIVTSVQEMIESVHCCYVILPPKKHEAVKVGGADGPAEYIQTRSFIDKLGPMFSYLTAQSYVHTNNVSENIDIRIDSFTSKQTRAWDILEKLKPKIYWKGDECDAYIACADLLAFLTDAKLYSGYLKLKSDNVSKVWKPYTFDVSVGTYGHGNLWSYAWYSNDMINVRPYLPRPTVFLSIDNIPDPSPDREDGAASGTAEHPTTVQTPFHHAIKQTDTYNAAIRKAFEVSGSLKIFKLGEDVQYVRDRDVFVYIGDKSKQAGKTLQNSVDITVMSGLELRQSIKLTN